MQNWNQWQLSAGAVTTSVSQQPVAYAAVGADATTLMQSYMQYYNQPTPSGYTPEQWAAAQQQGWAQWQQWQQQYQQWQAQYGEKYLETMKYLSAQNMSLVNQAQLPSNMQHPPLPKEDVRPPLPPTANTYQFTNVPPPHQNNLPLFPVKEPMNKMMLQANVTNYPLNPPLPTNQPPLPPEISNNRENISGEKRDSNTISELSSAKMLKLEEDELSEAEKSFDAQFKQWEEQFNKWRQQNSNHPDKTQYKQYEAKWTSWREKLIERREQMRKKREQQKQVAVKMDTDKIKDTTGDDKILNILSNTENQRLINNLLGIGKTLGLTGKQNTVAPLPPPPPPPPPPETTNSSNQPATAIQGMQQVPSQIGMMGSNVTSSWSNQQWGTQCNLKMEPPGYSGVPLMSTISSASFGSVPSQIITQNLAQPPPNLLSVPPNFSKPPPNFLNNDQSHLQNIRAPGAPNIQDCTPFGSSDQSDSRFMHSNDRSTHNIDGQFNFKRGEQEHFGRENFNPNLNEQQDQFRATNTFGVRNDNYNDRTSEGQRFKKSDRNYSDFGNNQNNAQNHFNSNNDRFGPTNDHFGSGDRMGNDRFNGGNNRFGSMGNERLIADDQFIPNNDKFRSERFGNERFGSENDRFRPGNDRSGADKDRAGSGNDRFGAGNDRFGSGTDRLGPDNDRFGSGMDRFGSGSDRFVPVSDRFASTNDRYVPGDHFGPSNNRITLGNDRFAPKDRFLSNNDRFGFNERCNRSNLDCFDPKDSADHQRDSFGSNIRGFNRNPQFSPPNELPPELKKLMEKRKTAVNVFRPSFLDSEKTSNVDSLSESFKKIAGDSPFKTSFDFGQKNLSPRGSTTFSNIAPSNFQLHSSSDSGQTPVSTYGPRSHSFDIRDNKSPGFRTPQESFTKTVHNSMDYNERLGKDVETRVHPHQSQLTNVQSQPSIEHSTSTGIIDTDAPTQTDNIGDTKNETEPMQIGESDSNVVQKEPAVSEDGDSSKKNDNEEENKVSNDRNSLQQNDNEHDADQTQKTNEKREDTSNDDDRLIKKSESLPFMGDNDPRPEDLNIESPPELPNLRSIPTDSVINVPFNPNRTPNESFDGKAPVAGQFNIPRDGTFDPKEIELKSNAPFGSRRPPMVGPRDPNMFPINSDLGVLQPQTVIGAQLTSQCSNDGQTVSNAFSDGRFNCRRPIDEQYSMQNRNSQQFGGFQGTNTGPLSVRDPIDERFGPRGINDGQFDSRGDGKYGPGGSIDRQTELPFALRNPGPFGPRGHDTQFRPRAPTDRLDSRAVFEGPFGLQGPVDRPYGPRGFSDISLGTRRPIDADFNPMGPNRFGRSNETSFEKRLPFDNNGSFAFSGDRSLRRSNEGFSGSRGSNDSILGSRGPSDTFPQPNPKDTMVGSRGFIDNRFNDGPFGPSEFKDRSPVKGSITESNNPSFSSRGAGDGNFVRNRDYMRRGSYVRRGQFEDEIAPKIARYETPKSDELNKSYSDRNIEMDIRRDNANGYARRIPHDSYKKELNESSATRLRYGTNDTWKQNKFDQVHDINTKDNQHSIDRNMPNTFDERLRLERNASESKMCDYRSGYSESSTGPEFQSKYGSNMFMKRSMEGRQPQSRASQEFCVQRQFNYNHGDVDKKYVEFVPAKIIDYTHMSRSSITDHLPSVQCFDYGHGNLKPVVPDCEQQPKKDFRNWVENEQNLKEYTDKIKNYETYMAIYDARKTVDYNKRKEGDPPGDKEPKRDRKEKEDCRESVYNPEERCFDNDQNERYQSDRSIHKERAQEICESSRRETNKDSDKDDNRSTGSVNWQESSNKTIDAKLQDSSLPDINKNAESTPKILELAKTPNYTMVDDLLCSPGRQNRPPKIVIILRGPPGSGKSFVAKLIKDKEVEQGGSAPRILSLDDYFLVEKEIETKDDNGKKITVKEMVYEYEEAMEKSYIMSLAKAFKKNITDGFFNFIILDCINEKISDYEEMWSFAKTKGFKVYICEMEMDLQICLKRNIHNRTEDEINRIVDYFEPTPNYHQKLDVNSMLQEQAIEEVDMEDSQETQDKSPVQNEDSRDSQEDVQDAIGVSKWEKMEAEDKLDRLDGLAKKKSDGKPQTMEDFLQVPDYYNMEDTPGKKRVRWADLEERKEQEKMRAVGFVVGHTNWDRMMDPTKGGSALTRTKYI